MNYDPREIKVYTYTTVERLLTIEPSTPEYSRGHAWSQCSTMLNKFEKTKTTTTPNMINNSQNHMFQTIHTKQCWNSSDASQLQSHLQLKRWTVTHVDWRSTSTCVWMFTHSQTSNKQLRHRVCHMWENAWCLHLKTQNPVFINTNMRWHTARKRNNSYQHRRLSTRWRNLFRKSKW